MFDSDSPLYGQQVDAHFTITCHCLLSLKEQKRWLTWLVEVELSASVS